MKLFIFFLTIALQVGIIHAQDCAGHKTNISLDKNGSYAYTLISSTGTKLITGQLLTNNANSRHGVFYFYHDNGDISAIGYYENDKPIGKWVFYNKQGDISETINFGNKKTNNTAIGSEESSVHTIENLEETYIIVEEMPRFDGGNLSDFRRYVAQHLKYPEFARLNCVSGKVYVQFAVSKDGKIVNAKIIQSVHPDLDTEALRVITQSPEWIPGRQKGKVIQVQFTVPVSFILN